MSPLPVRMTWNRFAMADAVVALTPLVVEMFVPVFPSLSEPLSAASPAMETTSPKLAAPRSAPAVRR